MLVTVTTSVHAIEIVPIEAVRNESWPRSRPVTVPLIRSPLVTSTTSSWACAVDARATVSTITERALLATVNMTHSRALQRWRARPPKGRHLASRMPTLAIARPQHASPAERLTTMPRLIFFLIIRSRCRDWSGSAAGHRVGNPRQCAGALAAGRGSRDCEAWQDRNARQAFPRTVAARRGLVSRSSANAAPTPEIVATPTVARHVRVAG